MVADGLLRLAKSHLQNEAGECLTSQGGCALKLGFLLVRDP